MCNNLACFLGTLVSCLNAAVHHQNFSAYCLDKTISQLNERRACREEGRSTRRKMSVDLSSVDLRDKKSHVLNLPAGSAQFMDDCRHAACAGV